MTKDNLNSKVTKIIFSAFITSLAIGSIYSCSREDDGWKKALYRVDKSKLFMNTYDGWELLHEIPSELGQEYTIQKIDNDTLKVLFFGSPKFEEAFVNEYREIFPCGNLDTCHLHINAKLDTLFYYKENDHKKIFLVGEYIYRYTYGELDSREVSFFEMHQDSLRRTKGNNLPKLPSLN